MSEQITDYSEIPDEKLNEMVAEKVMKWTKQQTGRDVELYGAPIFGWFKDGSRVDWATDWYDYTKFAPAQFVNHMFKVVHVMRERGWLCSMIDCGSFGYRIELESTSEGIEDFIQPSHVELPRNFCIACLGLLEREKNRETK